MKRLHTGLIIFDPIDIICLSISTGSSIAFLIRKYKKYKKRRYIDPIIIELQEKSPVTMFSENCKPLKLPLVRGGEFIKGFSLAIKNKKLASIVRSIIDAKRKQKYLRLLQFSFFTLNTLLTSSIGLRFAVGTSLSYTQFILIAFPSTVGGFLITMVIENPLASVLLPLAILYGRGIENVPNPYEKCKVICQVAEEFHNKQLAIEMQKLNSLVEDTATVLQLPLDKGPLVCVEEKLSLLQRYRLRELTRSAKARKRVQHFSEFIKKFPECDVDPKVVYEQIAEKIAE
jgi:hypothetical protein